MSLAIGELIGRQNFAIGGELVGQKWDCNPIYTHDHPASSHMEGLSSSNALGSRRMFVVCFGLKVMETADERYKTGNRPSIFGYFSMGFGLG